MVGRQAERQTGRQAERQAGRRAERQAGRQTGRRAGITKYVVAIHNIANTPKNERITTVETASLNPEIEQLHPYIKDNPLKN